MAGQRVFTNSFDPNIYILQNKEKFNLYNENVKKIEEFFQTATLPAFDNEYFYQQ